MVAGALISVCLFVCVVVVDGLLYFSSIFLYANAFILLLKNLL